jgi:hypothetical protein
MSRLLPFVLSITAALACSWGSTLAKPQKAVGEVPTADACVAACAAGRSGALSSSEQGSLYRSCVSAKLCPRAGMPAAEMPLSGGAIGAGSHTGSGRDGIPAWRAR